MSKAITGHSEEAKQLVRELNTILCKHTGEKECVSPLQMQSLVLFALAAGAIEVKATYDVQCEASTSPSICTTHHKYHEEYDLQTIKNMLKDLATLFNRWTGTGGGAKLVALRLHLKVNDAVIWDNQLYAVVPEEEKSSKAPSLLRADCIHRNPRAAWHGCDKGYVHCEKEDGVCMSYTNEKKEVEVETWSCT